MKRAIIKINEALCNGCGKCATACAEGAIKMVNGKAKLISDQYCDGLGACLGNCPTGALTIIEREAAPFNLPPQEKTHCQCPSMAQHQLGGNKLQNWPIQLNLVPATAEFLKNKEIIIAADCTAFASSKVREMLSPQTVLLIGCPKLDDGYGYVEKLAQIFQNANPLKVTVLRMEVPCCSGMTKIAQTALAFAHRADIEFTEVIIPIKG